MERILRIFVVNEKGARETFAFRLSSFVSYNIDTRLLTLSSGSVVVSKDSEKDVISAYRSLDSYGDYVDGVRVEMGLLKAENAALRSELSSVARSGVNSD